MGSERIRVVSCNPEDGERQELGRSGQDHVKGKLFDCFNSFFIAKVLLFLFIYYSLFLQNTITMFT